MPAHRAQVEETEGVADDGRDARDKRGRILDAAVEMFLDKGFDKTLMTGVAARAGVAKQTVYAYYSDKATLFRAVIDHSNSLLDVNLDHILADADSAPEQKLQHVAVALLKATTTGDHLALLRVILTERDRLPESIREPQSTAAMPYSVGVVASILSDDAARRGYSLVDPAAHASLFVRLAAASMQFEALVSPSFHPDERLLETHAQWVAHVFLDGVRPRVESDGPAISSPPEGYSYRWRAL